MQANGFLLSRGRCAMVKYDCLIVDDEEALSQSTCEYFNMFGGKPFGQQMKGRVLIFKPK